MKTVISASRRTDLPRWFLDDVISWFEDGKAKVKNPFNKQYYTVSLKKEDVHSIVWWSKDYSEYLKKSNFFDDFNQFFHFTINGYSNTELKFLEPGITSNLEDRLSQASQLVHKYGAETISWRFDPIVFWRDKNNRIVNNINDFEYIAQFLSGLGISRLIISFATWYDKCKRRAKKRDFGYITPGILKMKEKATKLAKIAKKLGMKTFSCSNNEILVDNLIYKSACIDGELLSKIFKEPASKAKHQGQRYSCNCTKSKDIGSYDMICKHRCMYCYANPQI